MKLLAKITVCFGEIIVYRSNEDFFWFLVKQGHNNGPPTMDGTSVSLVASSMTQASSAVTVFTGTMMSVGILYSYLILYNI